MYPQRFKNRAKKSIIKIKKLALFHLGGGTFLYSIPTGKRTIVGKLEFNSKRVRFHGFGLIFTAAILFFAMSLMPNPSTADSVSLEELEKLDAGLSPLDLEEKTEKLKQQLVDNEIRNTKNGKKKIEDSIEYTVVYGDTLSYIASHYRVPIEMITASSGIQESSIIRPGQKLIIPTRQGLVYKFKKNDRLAQVAQYYSVNINTIMEENPDLENSDIIPAGHQIFLPNAKIPRPPPVWRIPATGRITSSYGVRWHPVYRQRRFHSGIDIGSKSGSVYSAREGHIIFSGYLGSYGKTVIIEHTSGYKTLYAHLSKLLVNKGQYVKTQHKIGVSGNTGVTTGPHLHFEVIRYGKSINPRRVVRF